MADTINITKKSFRKGDDGYKIVSVRMKDETIEQLDNLSAETNRSRNELINILVESALKIVKIPTCTRCMKTTCLGQIVACI